MRRRHSDPARARLARAGVLLWSLIAASAVHAETVTDLAGRQVELPARVERIILGEGRYLPTLAMLEREQPLERVVGILPDFRLADPGTYRLYRERFPALESIPELGHTSADSFSTEHALTLDADVAIFSLAGHGPSSGSSRLIDSLEEAGVTVVFLDFRQQPLRNTPRSLRLLGKLLDREREAHEFLAFYEAELARVRDRLPDIAREDRPGVFLHSRAGLHDTCCETMADGMMGHFVDYAGGRNIARDRIPGVAGTMNLEYLLVHQPAIYIATAIGSAAREGEQPFVTLGPGVSPERARQSLRRATQGRGLGQLEAIQDERAYAIWHNFYNTPMNVVAVQVIAKWLYPERFPELDPRATLATLFQRFQPVPLDGVYWTGL
ncbi:ABC transporter substrate-binding protein [Aquisalimonas lutea]|uniref:ABC transporter substrate-binding protein n=1 Tax=Aquisalimonas lutea TaxID=1327750 RepID=UPI0025B5DDA0|nr:ABC transporter substrate-binding protein [Aquisalimonas lutea]MDN3518502.1 ABC transporter substrate-binding protein [Aquisalimonas lutea]